MGFLSKLARKTIKKAKPRMIRGVARDMGPGNIPKFGGGLFGRIRAATGSDFKMPRRRGGFLRGMPMMKPSIGDMRFRGEMPRGGGFGNLGEVIRRLNQQQGMRPQPISDRMPDQETLDKFRQMASRPNPFVRDMMNLQVPTDMPMTQDLPEVAPIGMMPQMRMGGMQDMEPRMMMQEGEDVSLERELFSLQAQLKNLEEQLRLDRSYNDDQAVINTSAEMAAIQKRIQEIMEGRPQLAGGGDFPDLTGDGKVTQADILKGRGVYAEGDEVIMEGNEIDAMLGGMDSEEAGAMEDLEQMAPEMEMIDQLVTMVVQMIQQGASEEEVIMFLREQGLDDEDIGTVLQLVAEMAEAEAMPQDGIGAELEQLV
jgi:hypothetical protein